MFKRNKTCKKVMGMRICKFKSSVIKLPKDPIPLIIYNSDECDVCNDVVKQVKKHNKNLGRIFTIEEIDIEKNPIPNSIINLPSMFVGNQPIIGQHFDENTLLESASHFVNEKKL